MSIESIINPPAIVRSVDENQNDVYYWHEQAVQACKQHCMSNLKHAEALYQINKLKGYSDMGFGTMAEYVNSHFSRSKQWAEKLILIHDKFVENLNVPKEKLEEVTFGKLSILAAHINEENKEQLLDMACSITQKELCDYVKHNFKEDKPKDEQNKSLRFKGPAEMVEVVETALDSAKEQLFNISKQYEYINDVPDLAALEFVSSVYLTSASLDGNPYETLERAVQLLEHAYKVRIQWETQDDRE